MAYNFIALTLFYNGTSIFGPDFNHIGFATYSYLIHTIIFEAWMYYMRLKTRISISIVSEICSPDNCTFCRPSPEQNAPAH